MRPIIIWALWFEDLSKQRLCCVFSILCAGTYGTVQSKVGAHRVLVGQMAKLSGCSFVTETDVSLLLASVQCVDPTALLHTRFMLIDGSTVNNSRGVGVDACVQTIAVERPRDHSAAL